MSKRQREGIERNAGRVTLATLLSVVGFCMVAFLFNIDGRIASVDAQAPNQFATTSVTVINLPPFWTVDAAESPASATTTPTNVGSQVTWVGTAEDNNDDVYWMIICKTDAVPTPAQDGPPECDGGPSNTWALSPPTDSGDQATATYTAQLTDDEVNVWYAFVCDGNLGDPACNATFTGHTGAATGSPFVVNQPVDFTVFSDDSPTLPGDTIAWTTTAVDNDTLRGNDNFTLHVCRQNDWTGTECGPGGTWAISSLSTSNPTATTTIPIPTPDEANIGAWGFIIDEFGLEAIGAAQGTNSLVTIANAPPRIIASSVDVGSSTPLTLTVPGGETTGLIVNLTVEDDNSCENASGGEEIDSVLINMHRSGVATSSCVAAGDYDTNSCYPYAVGASVWEAQCERVADTCSGTADMTEDWVCTFPLWFNADPTTAGSVFAAEEWVATLRAIDDDAEESAWTTGDTGRDLQQFLAFDVPQNMIAYGALEPGQTTGTLFATTSLRSLGNTGVDSAVFGTDMCVTYPSCTGNATSTIFVDNQQYATTAAVVYDFDTPNAQVLSTATSAPLQLVVPKPTATNTALLPAELTYWGIRVPIDITFAGDYYGQNTIVGVVTPSGSW